MLNSETIKNKFLKEKEEYLKTLKENDTVVFEYQFTFKGFTVYVYYEDDETVHYSITSIVIKGNEYVLPERVVDSLTEIEDLNHLEDYIFAIENRDFDWIKSLYSDLLKINEKYIDNSFTDEATVVNLIYHLLPIE
jgi:hypothetical protein